MNKALEIIKEHAPVDEVADQVKEFVRDRGLTYGTSDLEFEYFFKNGVIQARVSSELMRPRHKVLIERFIVSYVMSRLHDRGITLKELV